MLKEGSREQPVASNITPRLHTEPATRNRLETSEVFNFLIIVISMGLSYGVSLLSGTPERPWLSASRFARSRPRFALQPVSVVLTLRRSGCAHRSCTTPARRRKTRWPQPAAPPPPSVPGARCGPWNRQTTHHFPLGRESHRARPQPVSGRRWPWPASALEPIHRTTSR